MKNLFLLNPEITFLNFGSFGACPKPIFEAYQNLQFELESDPVQFIVNIGIEKLASARKKLGSYIGCKPEDLVFMINPSYAINTITKSIQLKPGDEILSTNLEYGAMDRTWNYYCQKADAKYIQQSISLPIFTKEQFIDDFWKGYTEKTKAIFISHITSATGLILPVKEICTEAKKRGLLTIVDGAHVPGHIPFQISEIEADIYTGACHKWMMAPKGASFLYVNKENQHWVDPLTISWGYQSDFPSNFQFIDFHQTAGTRDFSAFLTVPFCIDFMEKYNWREVASECRTKTIQIASDFQKELGFDTIAPIQEEFLGQMFSFPIHTTDPIHLKKQLYQRFKIEIPVTFQNGNYYLRFSFQVFNEEQDFNKLLNSLKILRQEEKIFFR